MLVDPSARVSYTSQLKEYMGQADTIAYLEHYIAQSSCSQIILASDGHVRIPDDA